MVRTILQVFVLFLVLITFTAASDHPPPWGEHGGKGSESTTTQGSVRAPYKPLTCPQPTEEILECVRQWACQYLIRLDLRCLLNLNGFP
ncbi:uncharacterized protein [Eurosta solidaginis]|uniref:uncharacterized protein n=1 Tax=Eurosta solidaginis TaxID=178769 RepID=UPI0035316827